MFIKDGKRFNPYATHTFGRVTYNGNILQFPDAVAALGIQEIAEPEEPADYDQEFWYRQEIDEAPFVIYTKKSDEQIAEIMLTRAKAQRAAAVASIVVATSTGKAFDGHEDAQNRMSRTLALIKEGEVTPWVLADNTVAQVTREELAEALLLAGKEQTRLWVMPYVK